MASPITCFIRRSCELRIQLVPDGDSKNSTNLPPHSDANPRCRRYVVISSADELFTSGNKDYNGYLSPTSRLTLPKVIKHLAGIPDEAVYYSFIHPPIGLINDINVKKHVKDKPDAGILDVAMNGGYVYFSTEGEVLRINAISNDNTLTSKLRFSGPFEVNGVVCDVLKELNRPKVVLQEIYHEAGFVELAWVRPNEKFRNVTLTDELPHSSGALLFFRDDGSAVSYIIDQAGLPSLRADVGSISSVIAASLAFFEDPRKNIQDATKPIKLFNPEKWRDQFKHMDISDDQEIDVSKIMENIEDKRTLIHLACHSGLESKLIMRLLRSDSQNLDYQDYRGWTPLHYACRYTPKMIHLIEHLIDVYVGAVLRDDKYGRIPLHIACDSDSTPEVIGALLKYYPEDQISKTTKYLKRCPLHVACMRRMNFDVDEAEVIIEQLLEVDLTGKTVQIKDVTGRIPLHGALQMNLSPRTIKLLLEEYTYETGGINDVTTDINGKLPLHIACWNNSPPDIVKMLLDKDKGGQTITMSVDSIAWDNQRSSRMNLHRQPTEDGTRALHLAAVHGSPDVVRNIILNDNGKLNTATVRNKEKKFPLHIACENNVNPSVIKTLLQEDPKSIALLSTDNHLSMPIHALCANSKANYRTLQLLIDAEDEYRRTNPESTKIKMSTSSVDNRNRSPLFLAVKAGATDEVLDILLRPKHFYLKGFDSATNSQLAERINHIGPLRTNLQNHIIDKLTERGCFFVFLLELYSNIFALFVYTTASSKLLGGELTYFPPVFLTICLFIFILRELVQIKSQSAQYIADVWSWVEVFIIGLLISSLRQMYKAANEKENFDKRNVNVNVLIFTSAMLTIQTVFFLRSALLPFARFVGGLLLILNTLIPFFIVSILILLAFAYCYRLSMYNNGSQDCNSLDTCFMWVVQGFFSGKEETKDIIDALFGFIAVIIILNVVIAIVNEGWTSAADRATCLYWEFRLDFLSEARSFFIFLKRRSHNRPSMNTLGNLIDNVNDVKFADDVCWTREPYSQVTTKQMYDEPEEWFVPEIASLVLEAHSLQADLRWTKEEYADKKSLKFRQIKVFLKWMGLSCLYLVLILLGILTFGYFMPRNFRKGILSTGIKAAYDEMEYVAKKKEDIEKEVVEVAERKLEEKRNLLERSA